MTSEYIGDLTGEFPGNLTEVEPAAQAANDEGPAVVPPKPRTRFMHVRAKVPDLSKPLRKMNGAFVIQTREEIVATVCSIEANDLVLIGVALRSKNDTPSRKRGREIAEGRARHQRGRLSWVFGRDDAIEFVKQLRFELSEYPFSESACDTIEHLRFLANSAGGAVQPEKAD